MVHFRSSNIPQVLGRLFKNYFDSNRAFTVILCIQAYLDRGYFWALFQLPPVIIYKNYNATEAVPITSRYYLQEYITLQKRNENW